MHVQHNTSAVGWRTNRHSPPLSTDTRHSQPNIAGPHGQQAQPRTCPGVLDGARCRDPCPSRAAAAGAAGAGLLLGVPATLLGSSSKASSWDCRSLAAAGAVLGRRGLGSCSQAMTVYCWMELAACPWLQGGWRSHRRHRQPAGKMFIRATKVQVAASPGHELLLSHNPPAGCPCGAHLHGLACPRQVWLAGWKLGWRHQHRWRCPCSEMAPESACWTVMVTALVQLAVCPQS